MTRMLLALVILSLSVTVALARHLMHNTPIDGAESLRTSEKGVAELGIQPGRLH